MNTFTKDQLERFCISVFTKMGCSKADAELATDVLVTSDLRGIDSHGVARLSGYVRLWEAKRINPTPNIKIVHETPSTATIDGDAGLGLVVAPKAMEIATAKAKEVGSGWISIKNSNHFGIAGYHSLLATKQNMVGISMTNASPLVAPTNSKERLLGTNPMCYALPAGKYAPIVADLATSAAANGKLEIAQRLGKEIPKGWVQDKEGKSSTDPSELKKGGALLPLGSMEEASHKGYALAAVVDIFSAVLSGANYGPWVPPFVSFLPLTDNMPGEGLGHFVGALRVDGFRPMEEYNKHIENWIERFKSSPALEGTKVLVPGEPEIFEQKNRLQNGIPLTDAVVKDLEELGNKFDIAFTP
jgi:LDH2 family malate/lactate/ureidoglycolate dehydrogenase